MPEVKEKIRIGFGATVPSIKEQLQSQNLKAKASTIAYWQKTADKITYLRIHFFLSSPATASAYKRLLKEISQNVHK